LSITAHDNDTTFSLVPLLLPSVEYIGGDFHAALKLNGTPSRPHLDGQAYLKDVSMKYLDLAQCFTPIPRALSCGQQDYPG